MFGAAREKCTKCGKTVYQTEKLNSMYRESEREFFLHLSFFFFKGKKLIFA
jgi:hypothetical protein